MPRITWYGLLAVVALAAPIAGGAQAPQTQAPQPQAKVRELATIEDDVEDFVRLPSGRTLIYDNGGRTGETFAYDIATKRRTLLGKNMSVLSVSPQGDRFAFVRTSEDSSGGRFIWTLPIDPKTGLATGQAQRVSLRPMQGQAAFSPDGRMLVFQAGPRPDGTGTGDVTLVPATGGTERVVVNYANRVLVFSWSADGKSLFIQSNGVIERVPVAGGPSEPLFARTTVTDQTIRGLSPDARVAIFNTNPDRFFYRTASGIEGEISGR